MTALRNILYFDLITDGVVRDPMRAQLYRV